MSTIPSKPQFRAITIGVSVLAGLVMAIGCVKTGGNILIGLVTGALIGAAAVPTRPGRPASLYVAFGLLMGYAFWLAVGSLREGVPLGLVLVLVLAIGAAWFLNDTGWPSALFASIASAALLILWAAIYRSRYDIVDAEPELIARGLTVALVMLGLGLVYVALALADDLCRRARKARKASRSLRTPARAPG